MNQICANCPAACCTWEAEITAGHDDSIPYHLIGLSEYGYRVMARGEDGYCLALDKTTMRCSIYDHRPFDCREFNVDGRGCRSARRLHARASK